MSDQNIEVQLQNQIKGLHAQLEATKQMLNESHGSQLQCRATIIIFQQQINESMKEIANLKAEKNNLIADKEKLLAQVTELDAKVTALIPVIAPPSGENENAINS